MKYHKTATMTLFVVVIIAAAAINASENENQPVVPKEKIMLFNGKDLTGWKPFASNSNADPTIVWSVSDGMIHCSGQPAGYMRTEKDYANYLLHVEPGSVNLPQPEDSLAEELDRQLSAVNVEYCAWILA